MKLNKINVVQLVIAAFAVAFFVGVAWKFCWSQPYYVVVEPGSSISPDHLEEALADEVKSLGAALNNPGPHFSKLAVPLYYDDFKKRVQSSDFPDKAPHFDSGFGQPGLMDTRPQQSGGGEHPE